MSNRSNKSYIPLKTLFKEAFLTILIPHKTLTRIPKNPRLNYRLIVPLLFGAGFLFAAIHLISVHNTLAFVTGRSDYGILIALPFFSLSNWVFASQVLSLLSKLLKKNDSAKRLEVAAFYLWFAWIIMPAFDLLNPILGTPFHLGTFFGAQVHISWFYTFPVLAIESFFILKHLLKLSGKSIITCVTIAISVPIFGRYFLEQVPPTLYLLLGRFAPGTIPADLHILVTPTLSGLIICIWLFQKLKFSRLKSLTYTALICLVLFASSLSALIYAPLPNFTSPSQNTTKLANAGGLSRPTHSYTFTSADLEAGTVTDNTSGTYQWYSTTYTGISFDFTPANETISDIKIQVGVTAVTDATTGSDGMDTLPKMQGCYAAATGNYYCSEWTSPLTSTGTYTFTISPSIIRTYTAGTSTVANSGDGSLGTISDWNTLIGNMTASSNNVIVHVNTSGDGQATPAVYDLISFNVVQLIVDYRTTMTASTWQWYQNKDAIQPDTSLAATNTQITNIHRNTVLRIRLLLQAGDKALTPGSDEAFKLQYAKMAGADCAGGDETWYDVGAIGATTDAWRGSDNATPADGAAVTATLLSANTLETYQEQSPSSTTNQSAIAATQTGEWDWVVQNYLAYAYTSYCFKMVANSGVNNTSYAATYTPLVLTAGDIVNLKGKINIKGKVNLR